MNKKNLLNCKVSSFEVVSVVLFSALTLGGGMAFAQTGGGNAVPIYEAIAKQIFKDKAPTPEYRYDPGRGEHQIGVVIEGAFVAFEPGEASIEPGDLLCSSRRPKYRSIADRRRQMGVGARSHCDIVVSVDQQHVRAIGGNVRGVVSLKAFPITRAPGVPVRVANLDEERPMFAHLKLRAAPIAAAALDSSPTVTRRSGSE